MAEPTTSKFLDKERRLTADCQVKLRLPLKLNDGTEYRVERFGVPIPAGTMLPKTAIVLGKLTPTPVYDAEAALKQREEALAKAEAELAANAKAAEEAEEAKKAELAKTTAAPAASAKSVTL